MYVYQIIRFNYDDGMVCGVEILKTYINLELAIKYIEDIQVFDEDRLDEKEYYCRFSDYTTVEYFCAINDKENDDIYYYNIIKIEVFEN